MDRIDVQQILNKVFGNTFDYHPDFLVEFEQLIKKSGSERKIIQQFIARLNAIIGLENIDYGLQWLEHLKKYGNLYSLHLSADSKNYRLLFSRNKHGKVFLHMFYEKSGKKKTSYEKHAPIALERRNYFI